MDSNLRMLREQAWVALSGGRYKEASDLLEDVWRMERDTIAVRHTYVSALMYQERWEEARSALLHAREQYRCEKQSIGTFEQGLAVCQWCGGHEDDAISEFRGYVEVIAGLAKAPRGMRIYSADRVGFQDAALLWYFAVRRENAHAVAVARRCLEAMSNAAPLRNWPASLGRFLLDRATLDDVAASHEMTLSFETLAKNAHSDILSRRTFAQLSFYKAVKEFSASHDRQQFCADLRSVLEIRDHHVDVERFLVRHEFKGCR